MQLFIYGIYIKFDKFIFTWMGALLLLNANTCSIPETESQNFDTLITTYLNFDEVSLKIDLIVAVIIF